MESRGQPRTAITGEGRGYLAYRLQSIIKAAKSRSLNQKPQRNTPYWFTAVSHSAALLMQPRPRCPAMTLPTVGQALPHRLARKCLRHPTDRFHGSSYSAEVPSSQATLALCPGAAVSLGVGSEMSGPVSLSLSSCCMWIQTQNSRFLSSTTSA